MIRVKDDSVRIAQLHQSVWHAISQYDALRKSHGINAATVITSGNDNYHSEASLHYMDRAADLRTNDVPPGVMETIERQLKRNLGKGFDVVWEQRGTDNQHLHVESHPKRP